MTVRVKKLLKEICSFILVVSVLISLIPSNQVFGDTGSTTPVEAVFYVLKPGNERPLGVTSQKQAKYQKAGTGTIAKAINISENDEGVAQNIVIEPDVSQLIGDDEKVVWYVCKKESDGWHVDGEIVKVTEETTQEETTEAETEVVTEETTTEKATEETTTEKVTEKVTEKTTEETTTQRATEKATEATTKAETTTVANKAVTTAHFAILKEGYQRPKTTKSESASKYTKVGDGKIYQKIKIDNDDAKVSANIAVEPQMDKYLDEDETVVWYVCKKEADGWHIDGEVVKTETETEPSGETTEETKAERETEKPTAEEPTTQRKPAEEPTTKKQEVTTEEPTTKKQEATTEEPTTKKQEQTTEEVTTKATEPETTTEEPTTEKATTSNSTDKDVAEVREIMKQMILTGDMTKHDVSKYNFKFQQYDAIWTDLVNNECYLAAHSYYMSFLSVVKDSNGKIQQIYIYGADAEFKARYERVKANVANAMAGIDPRMSDLEKALYLHDYIDTHVYYKMVGDRTYYSGSALGDGYAVCSGYDAAYRVLLHEAGIESAVQSSTPMNHAWTYIKLNGQWYHADSTWDDNRDGYETIHTWFIRNDSEFTSSSATPKPHHSWYSSMVSEKSTSTAYTNWFVHDVKGAMYYSNRYWYYRDVNTNSIKCALIDGSEMTTVIDGSAINKKVTIVSVKNGLLTYKIGDTTYTKTVK